jgi:hypothetical protein
MYPSSPAGAKDQPRPSQRPEVSPQQTGECVAAVEAADRSGATPESAGSKRVAPEQGLSGRPAKKPRVRSKM